MNAASANGLEGVVVAETRLSEVDGERGRLIIGGFELEDLARRAGFEAAAQLLLDGALPDGESLGRARAALGRARVSAFEQLPRLAAALDAPDGMSALRGATATLPEGTEPVALIGAIPVLAAAWWRRKSGGAPIPPDPAAPHAADFLRMVRGVSPATAEAEALDRYLVSVIDHGMNASTFTARVIASTGSDLVSAIAGAIGALKGPLHGGAPGPVLDMLDAIGRPERALEWLEGELAAGRRIMGMGHRIYRVRDPRAAVLEEAARTLEAKGLRTARLALARAVERAAEEVLEKRHPDRALKANVELATAVLLDAIGLSRELFSVTFAVGRVAGWVAHVLEQRQVGRLIRPASTYVGPAPSGRPD